MMDGTEDPCTVRHKNPDEEVPSLIRDITDRDVADFDCIIHGETSSMQREFASARESDPSVSRGEGGGWDPSNEGHIRTHSISISMPPSPSGQHHQTPRRVLFCDHDPKPPLPDVAAPIEPPTVSISNQNGGGDGKFYSQPMPKGALYLQSANPSSPITPQSLYTPPGPNTPQSLIGRDTRFDSFKTWSGKLERQFTILRGRPVEPVQEPETRSHHHLDNEALPVDRYFDALEGPELDTLRASEEAVLPEDGTWPFLLRFSISSFGICLGTSSQAILWKTIATSTSTGSLHVSLLVNQILWVISLTIVATVFSLYALKIMFFFEAVRREYYHPIRVNFFFAPWIALLFLCLGVPPNWVKQLPHPLWYVLMTPIFLLEVKIYGQWMSGGQRRLSKVANPSNHLSIVGNFVGALLGATMGLQEGPIFFFAIGLAHYLVLFVTLYQRLPTNATLPKELHPVFFLFVAAPSVASMAWAKIQGKFDSGSKVAYFIAMFLYFSLAVRLSFFRGFKFSLAWWAYTFPMTGAAIATIRYSNEVTNQFTRALALLLSAISTVVVLSLLGTTVYRAFIKRDLFPNDIAIAISDRPPIQPTKWFRIGNGGGSGRGEGDGASPIINDDLEQFLKFVNSDGREMEVAVDRTGRSLSRRSDDL